MNIKNIVFDLGNVILDIDTDLSKKAFQDLGFNNFEKLYTLSQQNKLFDNLEVGSISEKNFYDEIRNITELNLSDEQIEDAWNALIIDYKKRRIEILEKAKLNYRTFILSNTNSIHYRAYTKLLYDKYNIKGLESLVHKAYFSHEINFKKPDKEAFLFVLNDAGINAENTLFIDDNAKNIDAARELGITSYLLDVEKMEDIFDNDGFFINDLQV